MLRFFIGIAIPYLGVIGLLPWANTVRYTFMGLPFLYLWIFAWFALTSICLAICWYGFDRHRQPTGQLPTTPSSRG